MEVVFEKNGAEVAAVDVRATGIAYNDVVVDARVENGKKVVVVIEPAIYAPDPNNP